MSYFILEQNSSTAVMALLQEREPGHDLEWLLGQPVTTDGSRPRDIKVILDNDYDYDEHFNAAGTAPDFEDESDILPDYFDTLKSPIGSERFKTALSRIGVDNVEFVPASIQGTPKPVQMNYYVINVIGRIACIDRVHSLLSNSGGQVARIISLTLKPEAIAEAKMFRMHEYPEIIVVSDDVASAIRSLSGVSLMPADGWNDAHRF